MANRRVMSRTAWAQGDVLMREYFGGNVKQVLLNDQREAIGNDLKVEKYHMPRRVNAKVGTITYKNFTKDKERTARKQMPFSSLLIFSSDSVDVDIKAFARYIYSLLMAATSPWPELGVRYRSTFVYVIGGKKYRTLPTGDDYSIIGISNTHSYSPKIECTNWPRPFRTVWRQINRVANTRRMDLRIRNLQGFTEENEGRAWPAPVIEVGYANTMRTGGRGVGNALGRQRCKKQRLFPVN